MIETKSLTHADGGSLYFLQDEKLIFEIISNDSLDIQMGGISSNPITFSAVTFKSRTGFTSTMPKNFWTLNKSAGSTRA